MIIPKPTDLQQSITMKETAIGKAYVEFEEIISAFLCYNLLNGRLYMGFPVEINFFDKALFITNSLFWNRVLIIIKFLKIT